MSETASNIIQSALNNALVGTTATFKVDDILTRDVAGFRDAVTRNVAELLRRQNAGVVVDHCEVEHVAPRQVKAAFENVLRAAVMRDKVLNDARSYENQVLTRAGADSQSLTNTAELQRVQLVNEVSSQATNFSRILPEYEKNPALFVQKSLNATLGRALTNAEKWIQPATANGGNTELRLLLNRAPPKPKTETPP